jgi:uncharacterized repeat protein (TIGR03803 family)
MRRVGATLGAALVLTLSFSVAGSASTFTVLYNFSGPPDGAQSAGGLIADAAGNLYGTTSQGGSGHGTVFKLSPPATVGGAWTEAVLYSFTGGTDQGFPVGALIADALGNLYGTTAGSPDGCGSGGQCGTVFKLSPPATVGGAWTETVLYSFTGGTDGEIPLAGLIADAAGNLYGTTVGNRVGLGCSGFPYQCGNVFRLTPPATPGDAWTFAVLYTFGSLAASDGANPAGALIADAAGNLYGTTGFGGLTSSTTPCGGCGTVFKLTPPATPGDAWTETQLHIFNFTDGAGPFGALIADAVGSLYGTTTGGGANGFGTVFKLTPPATAGGAWTEAVLYSFGASGIDGAEPVGGLIADAAGNLYGTTNGGGANSGFGTVFQLAPPTAAGDLWTEAVLHNFTGSDGAKPPAGLLADAAGNLYGTTQAGGGSNDGTVFQLSLSVTFNGVPGTPNCVGQSISFLAKHYGGIAHAATALGYASVTDLQNAVRAFCGG